ncbi:MAG: ThiF family adenylyltransferase [Lamprobacter sp.]|uniref:ThiF family adenylyltransferase n=1 Tax=Lamprobacter sp. TaxID=3100796 RepID=UPI002B258688|nr:ThiF family adenylyltransferase [Lamprobacter sp.]MEA3643050.1 ThiF family adenylyltransferase [Lamprobacter sp.]
MTSTRIRFSQGAFAHLRQRLLADPSREAFGLLFGQREDAGDTTIIRVVASHFPMPEDYESRSLAHLRLRREYIYDRLVDMQKQGEADTLIDVHTHPFCAGGVQFSAHDDADERAFHHWLTEILDLHYASLVLSRSDYAARLWERHEDRSTPRPARVDTQTALEQWPNADQVRETSKHDDAAMHPHTGFLARSVLALGLDVLRQIVHEQTIAVVGVGGLGSIIAEHLIHNGFHQLHLIDHDRIEITNLNRIVGASLQDAQQERLKVDAVRDHLLRINPEARITAHANGVEEPELLSALANCDWIMLATDNHASRFKAQEIALRFGIPLISAGVNISVDDGRITDMSGEVITARWGDRLCLNCLGRIAPTRIAAETIPGLSDVLSQRGYVSGQDVKEPAVKTLNTMLATLAIDTLLNQFTGRQTQAPILVYENNQSPCIYPDHDSVEQRPKTCFHCG